MRSEEDEQVLKFLSDVAGSLKALAGVLVFREAQNLMLEKAHIGIREKQGTDTPEEARANMAFLEQKARMLKELTGLAVVGEAVCRPQDPSECN